MNSFRLLPETQTAPILKKVSIQTGSAKGNDYRLPALAPEQHVAFGPGKRFELVLDDRAPATEEKDPAIVEHRPGTTRKFPPPESSLQEWAVRQPEEVKAGLSPAAGQISEKIEPHQAEGDRLWFGKTFYNGEGVTGVGGFGYFDTDSRSYKLFAPPEIGGGRFPLCFWSRMPHGWV